MDYSDCWDIQRLGPSCHHVLSFSGVRLRLECFIKKTGVTGLQAEIPVLGGLMDSTSEGLPGLGYVIAMVSRQKYVQKQTVT